MRRWALRYRQAACHDFNGKALALFKAVQRREHVLNLERGHF
jgi:hypothetical protein